MKKLEMNQMEAINGGICGAGVGGGIIAGGYSAAGLLVAGGFALTGPIGWAAAAVVIGGAVGGGLTGAATFCQEK
ncbi:hypothetical protein C900_03258 [Fulvivirga imtechensis AK7]|uniref:Bacteriocin n=1 Tax=Fulvivirga imtechensis AK7 TaxID=1237149 RepID=L8JQ52_9BACT|nr:hypothetical protein [Fulvivirga imtechensis]ELR70975.1 hypothetical protein C900_03258 [Fulvivirga imtechensis AK7]